MSESMIGVNKKGAREWIVAMRKGERKQHRQNRGQSHTHTHTHTRTDGRTDGHTGVKQKRERGGDLKKKLSANDDGRESRHETKKEKTQQIH